VRRRQAARGLLLAALLCAASARADVVLDGSFDPGTAGMVVPSGSFDGLFADYLISDAFGQRNGQNLFQSFEQFDLDAGEVASFVDTGATGSSVIRNVLARVTGGRSSIDGLIRSQIAGADLFFLNPAGVTFGPTSSIDVPGAFHVSNADTVGFASGPDFETGSAGPVAIQTADPVAFGFMESGSLSFVERPAIEVDGALLAPAGDRLTLVAGGGLRLAGGANLEIQAGRVTLVSVDSPGVVSFDPGIEGTPRLEGFDTLGAIDVLDSQVAAADQVTGQLGSIVVRGATLRLDGATLIVEAARDAADPNPAPGVDIVLGQELDADAGSSVTTELETPEALACLGAGASACRAPDIRVQAPRVLLSGSEIAARSTDDGGTVLVVAPEELRVEGPGARISSSSGFFGVGDSTVVDVTSPRVTVADGAAVEVLTTAPDRPAGRIVLSNTEGGGESRLVVSGVSRVDAFGPSLLGAGESFASSGFVTITGFDSVSLDESAISVSTTDSLDPGGIVIDEVGALSLTNRSRLDAEATGAFAPARAGSIVVEADSVALSGNSRISSAAVNLGPNPAIGGPIDITATGDVVLDGADDDPGLLSTQLLGSLFDVGGGSGAAGSVAVRAENVHLRNGAAIRTDSSFFIDLDQGVFSGAGGASGDIDVTAANEITLEDGAEITSTAVSLIELAEGERGDVTITAERLRLEGASSIAADSNGLFLQGRADAGRLLVRADEVSLANDSAIRTESTDAGNAGTITVRGRSASRAELVELSGGSRIDSASSVAFGFTSGDAGSVSIASDRVLLVGRDFGRQSGINSSSSDTGELGRGGDAGSVFVAARTVDVLDGALVRSESSTGGDAGGVAIFADESVTVAGSAQQIDPDTLEPFEQVSAVSSSAFAMGDGGSVIVQAPFLLIDGGQITASSFGAFLLPGQVAGDAGQVLLTGPQGRPAERIEIRGIGIVRSETRAAGDGGSVSLRARSISMSEEAQVSTSTTGSGNGGIVRIDAGSLSLSGDAEIASDTEEGSTGAGGAVEISADTVSVLEGAEISSDTEGDGDAGDVRIRAGLLEILSDVADPEERAIVNTNSQESSGGDAGDIELDVGSLVMKGGIIAATAFGTSRGGNIRIGARNRIFLDHASEITATVEAPVDDPNAPVDVANIDIGRAPQARPQAVALSRGSRIAADATGLGGRAGDIFIGSETFFRSPDSEVSATSASGGELDGTVVIESPVVDVQSNLVALQTAFVDSASLIRASCAARGAADQGSFTVAARRGMPASPEGLLLAFDALGGAPGATPVTAAAGKPGEPVAIAQVAWNRGAEAFRGGNFEEAEKQLAAASRHFAQGGDPAQRLDALRGLAQAQQARGEYAASLDTLREALALAEQSGDDERMASVLGGLGNAQLALGDSEAARELLTRGIGIAKKSSDRELEAGLWNNLGNQQAAARSYADAVSSYEQAARLAAEAGDGVKEAKALSNAARGALEAGHPARAAAILARAGRKAQALPDGHEKAYVLIHLAKSQEGLARADASRERDGLLAAHALLQAAATLSKQLGDARALSYAYGNLGALYEGQGRSQEALYFTHQALRWAEQADAPEALYRWHWQAGRLYWAEGRGNEAIRSYRRAVTILEETRQETLARYESSELYFRRAVAPVYYDLAEALLRGADMVNDPAAAQQLLGDAQSTVELLRAAELRDYFRDECVVEFQAQARPLAQVSPTAAVIYPILMDDRLEILLGLPGGLERVSVDVPRSQVEAAAHRLRQQLQTPVGFAWRQDSQALYGWLVAPVAEKLEAAGVDTLVFVPDGALRTIPMAALQDGEHFLVERYALAVTPGLSLPDPRPLDVAHAGFLLAGVSEPVQTFQPLPAVPQELDAIRDMYGGELLLDEDFQLARFEREIAAGQPGVVHLATHAVFRGDARESFLLTHDDRLTMEHLGDVVGRTRYREHPLELLTLSACETAAGDDRAALGLAGVAIRAGARSALGSLWKISDEATSELVVQFYANLKNPALSKAQALQRAQQKLLASGTFSHPFYWSPFLLISNWL
jgi:filamentous hemagglutinin family protein